MRLEHEFVDHIPDDLMDGRLYVSIRFGTVVHLCACGCGEEVVTPLGPSEWKIVFDGVSISLEPSTAREPSGLPSAAIRKVRIHVHPALSTLRGAV